MVEECPIICRDNSEYKKFYSKNVYSTYDNYTLENYYSIVTIIIDQLVNFGPVATSVDLYQDFHYLETDENCSNKIYTHDEKSSFTGRHGLVIIGYGYNELKSKYYWILQNSWGDYFCDNGFVKVEFGQIGVERVCFSEPYLPDISNIKSNIFVNLDINENCEIIITNSTSNFSNNLDELKNSIEINFKNNYSNYYYQCGIANLYSENKFYCFGTDYYYQMKGEYKFDYIISIGTENNIQSTFKKNELTYYGLDFIYPNYHCDFYVSEEGSKIIFYYYSYNKDDRLLTNIYPNLNTTTKLLNCHRIILQDRNYDLIYCSLYEYELHYFENTYNNSNYYLAYDILCGKKESIQSIIHIFT